MTRTFSRPASARALRQRNRLVDSHRDLVPPLALHYAHRCPEPLEDLQQVGLIGLIRAAELYRPEQGTPFPAFARPHIRGAILHHLRDVAPRVRLPRRQAERLERLLKEQGQDQLRPVAKRIALPAEERDLLLRQRRLCRTLPLEGPLLEGLAAQEPEEATQTSHLEETARAVRGSLERLNPRERHVVAQVVLEGASYRHLAHELRISPVTVKRLLQQGLDSLRRHLEDAGVRGSGCSRPAPSGAPGC